MNAPTKTVAVPLAALGQLFDMGNYGSAAEPEALDVARNVIRHAALELQVIGDAVGNPEANMLDDQICTHCHRVSTQLLAALEIVDAMPGQGLGASIPDSEVFVIQVSDDGVEESIGKGLVRICADGDGLLLSYPQALQALAGLREFKKRGRS